MKYTVCNADNEWEYLGMFETRKEAQEFIRDLKQFDKEMGSPFDDNYVICEEAE